ncbi:ankyrin repeat-containing domain protein [Kalaharituber pfeilii]|nr:ankyrin repeat-containing domain protein [Kalaharituber pfeilii]
MCAALKGAKECLELLLSHPVARQTVSTPNKFGWTPLAALYSEGWVDITSEDNPITDHTLDPPSDYGECLKLLLQMAPDVNLHFCDSMSCMPLMSAAKNNRTTATELLLQHAISQGQELAIDAAPGPHEAKLTALAYAAMANNVKSVKWLLRHGADPNIAKGDIGRGVFELVLGNLAHDNSWTPGLSVAKVLRAVAVGRRRPACSGSRRGITAGRLQIAFGHAGHAGCAGRLAQAMRALCCTLGYWTERI